jgi:hypothetical protein
MRLTNKDRERLLEIAKETINFAIKREKYTPVCETRVLNSRSGVFISFYLDDILFDGYTKRENSSL